MAPPLLRIPATARWPRAFRNGSPMRRKTPQPALAAGREIWDLVVLEKIPESKPGYSKFKCRCRCGQIFVAASGNILAGRTQSCKKCGAERRSNLRSTHGACRVDGYTPEYRAYCHIIDRCCNPNAPRYCDYGGRGIGIFPEWRYDFATFFAYVGPRPTPKHSIDRYPNNDGNYEPGNVRWATRTQQNRNTRRNRNLTHNGKTMTMTEWAEFIGIKTGTLWYRLEKGWTMERSLSHELRP